MTENLIYTNAHGESVEFSLRSVYRVYIPSQVTGLCVLSNTIYRAQIMDRDGSVETGYHVEDRAITITGMIFNLGADQATLQTQRAALLNVLTPHQDGTLAYTVGGKVYTIPVRVASVSVQVKRQGELPAFIVQLAGLDPYWNGDEISYHTGPETEIAYYGTMGCGIEVEIEALDDGISLEEIAIEFGGEINAIAFATGNIIDNGDVVVISTRPDSVLCTLNGEANIALIDLDNSDLNTAPLTLYPGANTFTWAANGDEANLNVTIRYTPRYLGV